MGGRGGGPGAINFHQQDSGPRGGGGGGRSHFDDLDDGPDFGALPTLGSVGGNKMGGHNPNQNKRLADQVKPPEFDDDEDEEQMAREEAELLARVRAQKAREAGLPPPGQPEPQQVPSLFGGVGERRPGVEHRVVVGHHGLAGSHREVQDQVAPVGSGVQQVEGLVIDVGQLDGRVLVGSDLDVLGDVTAADHPLALAENRQVVGRDQLVVRPLFAKAVVAKTPG